MSRPLLSAQTVRNDTVFYTRQEHTELTAEVLDLRRKNTDRIKVISQYDKTVIQLKAAKQTITDLGSCHRWLFCPCRRILKRALKAQENDFKPPG